MKEEAQLPQLLIQVFNWFDRSMLDRMAAKGWPELTRTQSMVMAYIPEDGIRSSHIASKQKVTRQAIHQTLNELVNYELVELRKDPANASAKLVFPTKRGRKCIADAKSIFHELEGELGLKIGKTNVGTLTSLLKKSYEATKA